MKLLNDIICIHHNDSERENIRCPVCLRKENDRLRAALREALSGNNSPSVIHDILKQALI